MRMDVGENVERDKGKIDVRYEVEATIQIRKSPLQLVITFYNSHSRPAVDGLYL